MSTDLAADAPRRSRRPKRRSRVGWIIGGVVLLVLVAAAVWVGVRGALAANELKQALPVANRIQDALLKGDDSAAQQQASALAKHADRAHSLTSDPVWWLAERIPGLGPNLSAVGDVSASAARIADDALPPLVKAAHALTPDSFKPVNGALPLAPLVKARPSVVAADRAVTAAAASVEKIDTSQLVGPLASPIADYRSKLTQIAGFTDAADRATALLPSMLGHSGTRTYLLLFLNNAELRATGGIPGSVAHVTVSDGKITLDNQVAGSSFGELAKPAATLDKATQQLYGKITGTYMQDVTLTPHFDQSAKLAVAMWKQRFGQSVDGVISLDPVALSYLLKATGPVTVAAGTPAQTQLTADNTVKTLLSDVYAKYPDPTQQDLFFQAASAAVFAKLTAGSYDPTTMLEQFVRIGSERRLNVWSSHASEEKSLAETTLAGGLPAQTDSVKSFGVYLADGTGSKMDYYLTSKVEVGVSPACTRTGPVYVLTVTITNTAPTDAATSLPEYVTGGGAYGVPPGTARTIATVYAPPGFTVAAVHKDGKNSGVKSVVDDGYTAAQWGVDLKPGKSSTMKLAFTSDSKARAAMQAVITPQVHTPKTGTLTVSCNDALQ
ncbi:DUF4012 domain-containing protein [Gryllotalpicola ginsengisoli]|uniref:DUF4012 domain-containing protein n=1 Tax=Gryllotalpicola ginsengisoli TaxID=444608 RepID=UPI000426C9EC|nr:DUF4012 domain-containing protein [Gryllotalpicola ginsengisoli]